MNIATDLPTTAGTVNTGDPQTVTVTFRATVDQIGVIEHPARIKVLVAGRRWGKSVLQALYLAKVALENPGCTVWYVCTSYAQSLQIMRMMKRNRAFMEFVSQAHMQFPPRFELKNGSTIAFRSADNEDNLRGAGLLLICLDEAAYAKQSTFANVLLPMIADSGGTILLASTYNGRDYFYDLANIGMEGKNERIATWVFPTRTGLRFRGPEGTKELEALRTTFAPAVWDQEYECIALAVSNAVFRGVDMCVGGVPQSYNPNCTYIAGFDIGRVKDPSACVVIECETGNIVYCTQFDLGEPHAMQAQRLRVICDTYRAECVADGTIPHNTHGSADSYITYYREAVRGIREVIWTRPQKIELINNLALEIEQKKIAIPPHFDELIAQLKIYRYKVTKDYHLPTYGPPSETDHDDQLAALAMAAWGRKMHWNRKVFNPPPMPPPGSQGRIFYDQRHPKDKGGTL